MSFIEGSPPTMLVLGGSGLEGRHFFAERVNNKRILLLSQMSELVTPRRVVGRGGGRTSLINHRLRLEGELFKFFPCIPLRVTYLRFK
jgi:hypothetical protein